MKIISLVIENIKKITAAKIVPKDSTILVQGDNAAGKSSVLDSIVYALCGGKSIDEKPIKDGESKAKIVIEMEDFTVTRSFSKSNSYLKIESKDGNSTIKSPQEFLDKLVGKISFDPLEFINNEPKKQRQILMEMSGVNTDEIDKKEKELSEERTGINRELKNARAILSGLTKHETNKTEEVSIAELSEKLTKIIESNHDIDKRKEKNEILKNKLLKQKDEIESLKVKLSTLETTFESEKETYKKEKEEISKLEYIDTEELRKSIQTVEAENEKVRGNKRYGEEEKRVKEIQNRYDNLSASIESIRKEKENMLNNIKIPISGLSIDADGLLYNSIPLSQCSDGEKLMVSMSMSMALNPQMRVIRIKDGSLLGKKNLDILKTMVKEKDFQLWIEKVADFDQYKATGKVGIFIEEGKIIEDEEVSNTKPVDDSW